MDARLITDALPERTAPTGRAAAARMRAVAAVASRHAAAVDRDARFPAEAVAALKAEGLLGLQIPTAFGGEGAGLRVVADLCRILGGACSSAAMVFAMHHIKCASLVAFGAATPWLAGFMREVARDQLLIASATTEGGIGGDLRNSICAVVVADDRFTLEKDATVISYGSHADAILATARRAPDAASSEQVMVAIRRADRTLERTTGWDTLGMRGTCSEGFRLVAAGEVGQIFPAPFSEIAAQSMLATSHILWSAVWFGIAADAVERAQAYVKAEARRRPGTVPPGAVRLAEAGAILQTLKGNVVASLERYAAARREPDGLSGMDFAVAMNNLKVSASQLAPRIVDLALLVTGIQGFKNDTPYSVGRHMRDLASGAVMISNDRILANTSNLLLVSRFDTSLAA